MRLDPTAIEAGVALEALAAVGSTNDEARSRARAGARGPLWITAQTQTAGRGRGGRAWFSPPGNLYASLLLTDPSPIERAPELAFVAALAVRDAIAAEAPGLAPQLSFKWPNDLLLDGEKCAGILIEGELLPPASRQGPKPKQAFVVVIGIGVNCAHHPPAMSADAPSYPATDLAVHAAPMPPERLFLRLSSTMCRRLSQWDRGRGFAAIRRDWLASARGIGETVTVRNGKAGTAGRFAGLDPAGRLVLQLPDGTVETVAAGDVFPLGGGAVD